jgi:hypothetical protein
MLRNLFIKNISFDRFEVKRGFHPKPARRAKRRGASSHGGEVSRFAEGRSLPPAAAECVRTMREESGDRAFRHAERTGAGELPDPSFPRIDRLLWALSLAPVE